MKKQLTLPKCQSLLRFRDYVIVKKRSLKICVHGRKSWEGHSLQKGVRNAINLHQYYSSSQQSWKTEIILFQSLNHKEGNLKVCTTFNPVIILYLSTRVRHSTLLYTLWCTQSVGKPCLMFAFSWIFEGLFQLMVHSKLVQ